MDPTSKPIFLYNSLSRSKEEFKPKNGKLIKWYNCGPTVYDSSHMGHARSYVTFDIIRRVLQDYFGYHVFFVQNVTDIDDKIIKRARQSYLFQRMLLEIKEGKTTKETILSDIKEGINRLKSKLEVEKDADKRSLFQRTLEKAEKVVSEETELNNLIEEASVKDILMDVLDSRHKSQVTDNSIFADLPKMFEDDFNQDMASLNILAPNVVTRVSEYVPEIIEYIEQIICNKFAYESNGSVYFDVKAFSNNINPKHKYAKLVSEAVGDLDALKEGEGDLFTSSNMTEDKKSLADFVLWKKSKEGEPSWESKFGRGRPGWHIECSVMASALLGDSLDIHSGGIDLRFPHHDNEVAQSEAYYNTGRNWVDFFLHSGHLTIEGCKMSKSLKNFKTIKEELKEYSQRQIRMTFLLHPWNQTLNYSQDTLKDAVSLDKYIFNFFLTVKHIMRSYPKKGRKWTQMEIDLNQKLLETQESVDAALRDNIDTKTALEQLKELINSWNVYEKTVGSQTVHVELTEDIAKFIRRILQVFGVVDVSSTQVNFDSGAASASSVDTESIVMPFVQTLADFRLEMRSEGIKLKNSNILRACDRLRDEILPELGVRMEDKEAEGVKTVVKLIDRQTLLREQEEKKRLEERKALEKEIRRKETEEKESRKSIPASQWVRMEFTPDRFSRFDDKGIPTHDKEGNEVSKGQRKKFVKMYETQEKKYQEFLSKSNGSV